MTFTDSGLRWCIEHGSPHHHQRTQAPTPVRIGKVRAGTHLCAHATGAANRAWEGRGDYPTECRWVALLIDTEPVTLDGQQGALL